MTVLSYDLNASRIRAVSGPVGDFASTIPLQPPHESLPLVLNLEGRTPTVGITGVQICREKSHSVVQDFLPYLGEVGDDPRHATMRHRNIDSEQALRTVFEYLRPVSTRHGAAILTLPPYLGSHQVFLVRQVTIENHLPLLCTLASPLANALTAFAEHNWKQHAIVIDVDEHALWLAWVREEDGQAHLADVIGYRHLGLKHWKNRLLNTLADLCIKESRKDPRHCPDVEQSLYMQLDGVMDDCANNRIANVAFQKDNWYQHLVLEPERIAGYFASFIRPVMDGLYEVLERHIPADVPRSILISAQAAVLPGLVGSIEDYLDLLQYRQKSAHKLPTVVEEDFGENLLDNEFDDSPKLILLSPDAAARGAHLLSAYLQQGEIAGDHLDRFAPLPALQPVEVGPARIQFQGRDYVLSDRPFTIGRRHDCHLVLDKVRFPHISPWHCEILFDPRRYLLRDMSREGTWINDRPVTQITILAPGDWIRLGPKGPTLRFLGHPENRPWITTA
jgi:hypothetical protein